MRRDQYGQMQELLAQQYSAARDAYRFFLTATQSADPMAHILPLFRRDALPAPRRAISYEPIIPGVCLSFSTGDFDVMLSGQPSALQADDSDTDLVITRTGAQNPDWLGLEIDLALRVLRNHKNCTVSALISCTLQPPGDTPTPPITVRIFCWDLQGQRHEISDPGAVLPVSPHHEYQRADAGFALRHDIALDEARPATLVLFLPCNANVVVLSDLAVEFT